MLDEHAATELELFIDNDEPLYRQMTTPIHRNLATKKARGEYQHDLAVKGFMHLMDAGAKKYAHEFATPSEWNKIFSPETRREVARRFAKEFETEYSLGNYDHLLPKKYQKKAATVHATKKTPSYPASLSLTARSISFDDGTVFMEVSYRYPTVHLHRFLSADVERIKRRHGNPASTAPTQLRLSNAGRVATV